MLSRRFPFFVVYRLRPPYTEIKAVAHARRRPGTGASVSRRFFIRHAESAPSTVAPLLRQPKPIASDASPTAPHLTVTFNRCVRRTAWTRGAWTRTVATVAVLGVRETFRRWLAVATVALLEGAGKVSLPTNASPPPLSRGHGYQGWSTPPNRGWYTPRVVGKPPPAVPARYTWPPESTATPFAPSSAGPPRNVAYTSVVPAAFKLIRKASSQES